MDDPNAKDRVPGGRVPRIFLTHTPEALKNYYGDRALAGFGRSAKCA